MVGLDSTPGQGSTFWIEADRTEPAGPDASASLDRAAMPSELAGASVFVIDDEGVIVRIDLPRLRDDEPQRWIRMLWPSEF